MNHFQCEICEKRLATQSNLLRHKRDQHAKGHFSCPQCEVRFQTLFKLEEHVKTHEPQPIHSCQNCGKTFSNKRNLTRHLKTHEAESSRPTRKSTEHECNQCHKKFDRPAKLRRHLKWHDVEFKCDMCEYVGKLSRDLKIHKIRPHVRNRIKPCVWYMENASRQFNVSSNMYVKNICWSVSTTHHCLLISLVRKKL